MNAPETCGRGSDAGGDGGGDGLHIEGGGDVSCWWKALSGREPKALTWPSLLLVRDSYPRPWLDGHVGSRSLCSAARACVWLSVPGERNGRHVRRIRRARSCSGVESTKAMGDDLQADASAGLLPANGNGRIAVFARVRPLLEREVTDEIELCVTRDPSSSRKALVQYWEGGAAAGDKGGTAPEQKKEFSFEVSSSVHCMHLSHLPVRSVPSIRGTAITNSAISII